jgi:protocatechuate 3,4-dioxygenase beta subunit
VQVAPGATREVGLLVPRGLAVEGRVLDVAGAAVGGARIYSKRREHHAFFQLVAIAGGDGRFTLRHVEPTTQLLARAEGYQPSHHGRGRVAGAPGESVRITLRLGARAHRVLGEVLGGDGAPVPHAVVAIAVDEDARKQADGLLGPKHSTELTRPIDLEEAVLRCDADGRFDSREVPMGQALLLARAPDAREASLGVARLDVRPGIDNHVRIVLGRGASIEGEVRDEEGRPIAGLSVLTEWEGTRALGNLEHGLGHLVAAGAATTGEDGRFRLTGLLAGEHELVLGGTFDEELALDDDWATATERVVLAEAQVLAWRGTYPRRVPLRVRLLDPDRRPLAGWAVHAAPVEGVYPSERALRRSRTDAEGRVLLPWVPEGRLHVSAHPPGPDTLPRRTPAHVERGVPAGPDEVLIVLPALPTAVLRGRVLGKLRYVELVHVGHRTTQHVDAAPDTGDFRFDGLPAGHYRLVPRGGPLGSFGPYELGAGQEVDAGELRVDAGGVAVFHASAGSFGPDARLEVRDRHGEQMAQAGVRAGELRTPALLAGRYVAFLHGSRFAPVAVPFELGAAGETIVPVALPPGTPVRFEVVSPVGLGDSLDLDLSLRAHGTSAVVRHGPQPLQPAGSNPRTREFTLALAPGSYELRAEVAGRPRAQVEFVVPDAQREAVVLRIE